MPADSQRVSPQLPPLIPTIVGTGWRTVRRRRSGLRGWFLGGRLLAVGGARHQGIPRGVRVREDRMSSLLSLDVIRARFFPLRTGMWKSRSERALWAWRRQRGAGLWPGQPGSARPVLMAPRRSDVRAAVGSLGECGFASLRSAMPTRGRRSEPLRHDGAARKRVGRRRGSARSLRRRA